MDITSYLLGKKAGGGGEAPTLINKNISTNGTYNASNDNADGYKKVVVDVSPNLETKSITIIENTTTTITPTTGKDGISSVSITTNVPQSGGRNWNAIGYSNEPQSIVDGYNYAKEIYDNWNENSPQKFTNDKNLQIMPLVDTSKITDFSGMFRTCYGLYNVPQIDTSNGTRADNMFREDYALIQLPEFDFGKMERVGDICGYSYYIKDIGGFKDLGEAYLTTQSANYNNYKLILSNNTNLTHDSLMNVINKLYDIATKGCNTQALTIGATNLAKLTAEEIAIATNKGWTVS